MDSTLGLSCFHFSSLSFLLKKAIGLLFHNDDSELSIRRIDLLGYAGTLLRLLSSPFSLMSRRCFTAIKSRRIFL